MKAMRRQAVESLGPTTFFRKALGLHTPKAWAYRAPAFHEREAEEAWARFAWGG